MRIWCIVLPVLMITWAHFPAQGQDGADALKAAAVLKQMVLKFDANGDGKIDDDEREKAAETLKKQFKEGKLPPQEAAMLKAMMAQLQNGGGLPQLGAGGRDGAGAGASATPWANGQVPAEVLKKFDKNKDGKLDEAEQKAAVAALGPKKSRKDQLLEKLDLNGDGKITQEERDQVAAQRKAEADEKKAEAEEKKAKSKKKDDKDKDDKDQADK